MRKAKSLLGLKIITRAEGKDLGTVKDLIFSGSTSKLLGLLLTERELFGMIDATCIPWNQVREIGPHAILVDSVDSAAKVHNDPIVAEAYDAHQTIDGKQITTESGENLGRVSDLYLDDNGQIIGYEVSGGLFSDAFNGKRFMTPPPQITHGRDVVIVPKDVSIELERERRARQNDANAQVGTNAQAGTLDRLQSSVSGAVSSATASLSESYQNIANASVEKQREFVVGKLASRDVIIPAESATMATPETIPTTTITESAVSPEAVAAEVTRIEAQDHLTSDSLTGDDVTLLDRPTPASATDVDSQGTIVTGEVLVRQGETITETIADRAIAAGILPQLLAAAAGSAAQQGQSAIIGYGEQAKNSIKSALSSTETSLENAAIGKPAAHEITAPDGSIIVAPGMIITREILQTADLHGKKKEVIASAGWNAASQTAQDTYVQAKDAASTVWNTLKQKAEELTGAAQDKKSEHDQAALEKQIRYAIGRPVTRVILSRSDEVILNTGDIITNKAVEQARQAGMLDILLDSVHDASPEITPDMLRTTQSGQAALDTQVQPAHTSPVAVAVTDAPTDNTV